MHEWVEDEDAHPERARAARDAAPDLAEADEPEDVPAQVAADEARALPVVAQPVPFLEEALRPREPAREHDEKGDREIGHRFRVLSGGVDKRKPAFRYRLDVDVHRAAARAADE